MLKKITLLSFLLLFSSHTHAGDLSVQDLLELDIKSLSSVKVYSASKKDELINEAPSIVSVVTADEISVYGGLNLHDILNRVPSLQVINSTANPNNTLSLRATTNQHYTNRILFLLDGRPMRDGYSGNLNYSLFLQYPVSNIEQIEVIRGPGSVLYGTNAYAGIINIVSRKAENGRAELSALYGSWDRKEYEGSVAYAGEGWSISTAFKTTDARGERFTLTDETNTTSSYYSKEHGHGYFIKGHYKNLSLTSFVGRAAQTSLGIFARFPESLSDGKRSMVDIGYKHDFSDHTSVQTNITYNRLRGGFTTDAPEVNKDNLLIAELSAQTKLSDTVNLLYGGFFEHQDGVVADKAYQQHLHNLYTQIDWRIWPELKLVGGLQLNDSEDFKHDFSPRFAAIYTPAPHYGVKLLYGEAFRSATAIERDLSLGTIINGDKNTKPETIETLEAQLFYKKGDIYSALTAYRSRIDDIIGRTTNTSGPGILITNTGEQVFRGLEFETQVRLDNNLYINGSASWQEGESDTDIDDPTFFPNMMAKLGLAYKTDYWSLGIFNSWFGDPEDIRSTNPSVLEVNDQPESYSLLSANFDIELNSIFDLPKKAPNLSFTLYGENLLDEDIYFPEYNRKNINSFPIDYGRSIYGRLTMKF